MQGMHTLDRRVLSHWQPLSRSLSTPNKSHTSHMSHIYNSLPYIEETSHLLPSLQDSVLPEARSLLQQYNLSPLFGVVLLHRHFTLSDQEQVVDLPGPGTIVSSIFAAGHPNEQVIQEYNLRLPEEYTIVPARFLVRQQVLVPYEFKCISSEDEMEYLARRRVPEGFLRDWAEVLERNGAEGMLGIADVSLQEGGEGEGVEYTDLERRLSVVVMDSEGTIASGLGDHGGGVPTLWQSGHREASRMCHCGG
jgi:hypothetical protein